MKSGFYVALWMILNCKRCGPMGVWQPPGACRVMILEGPGSDFKGIAKPMYFSLLLINDDASEWYLTSQHVLPQYSHTFIILLIMFAIFTKGKHIQSHYRTQSTLQRQNHVGHIGSKQNKIKYRPKFSFHIVMLSRAGPNHRPQQEEWNITATVNVTLLMLK